MFRSAFIEEMIEPDLREQGWQHVGGWCGYDFRHKAGPRLEVKQSAAQQLWSATWNFGPYWG